MVVVVFIVISAAVFLLPVQGGRQEGSGGGDRDVLCFRSLMSLVPPSPSPLPLPPSSHQWITHRLCFTILFVIIIARRRGCARASWLQVLWHRRRKDAVSSSFYIVPLSPTPCCTAL